MRVENWDCGCGTWFQLRHICPAMMFPRNCRASYDMLGLPFFVVWENLAEHWLGNEIQTCNLRGQYKAGIWNTGLRYRPWTQGPIWIWASWCCTLAPHQAWNQGPIWVWAPRCRTEPEEIFFNFIFIFILISNHIFIFLSKFGGRKPFLCFIYLILHMNFTTYSLIFFIPLVDSEKGIYN